MPRTCRTTSDRLLESACKSFADPTLCAFESTEPWLCLGAPDARRDPTGGADTVPTPLKPDTTKDRAALQPEQRPHRKGEVQRRSLLCNGVIVVDDTGELLPEGSVAAPRRVPMEHLAVAARRAGYGSTAKPSSSTRASSSQRRTAPTTAIAG
ncbi:DUF5999 family protein [Streptomyces caeni]|uniref:DUF5999 family protein n=1 Tax=Streptomyces caeni TaxID=2307231 RepID=A0ABW4IQ95_9ACTN